MQTFKTINSAFDQHVFVLKKFIAIYLTWLMEGISLMQTVMALHNYQ
jgi:hypothetical protein